MGKIKAAFIAIDSNAELVANDSNNLGQMPSQYWSGVAATLNRFILQCTTSEYVESRASVKISLA